MADLFWPRSVSKRRCSIRFNCRWIDFCQHNTERCDFAASNRAGRAALCRVASAAVILCAFMLAGCAGPKWVAVRDNPRNPLTDRLKLLSRGGPQPSERTMMFLRQYDLQKDLHDEPCKLLGKVQTVIDHDPSPEAFSSAAELAYVGAARSDMLVKSQQAFNLYCASVAYSYAYLFNPKYALATNPYDPQFRGTCDLYNAGLEAALRNVNKQGKFKPGEHISVDVKGQQYDVAIEPRNVPWPADDIERFEFVSDYEIHGLKNVFHTYGLGVPLIAVRKEHPATTRSINIMHRAELSGHGVFALSAGRIRRRLAGTPTANPALHRHRAVLELYDPLQSTDITVSMAGCRWKATSPRRWPIRSTIRRLPRSTSRRRGCCIPTRSRN